MRCLRWMGLLSSLLIVGVLGGLLAPLSSEALTVKIAGSTVQITPTSAACSSGYNLCSFIRPGQYGTWMVGDVSSTNKARIMIADNSAANSLDLLKLTGITFTPWGRARRPRPSKSSIRTMPVAGIDRATIHGAMGWPGISIPPQRGISQGIGCNKSARENSSPRLSLWVRG